METLEEAIVQSTIGAYQRAIKRMTVRNVALLAERDMLREALDKLQAWFTSELGGAFSNQEYLLGGCPNELRADVERARASLAPSKG